MADDHKVSADDLDLIAAFKENFRDWSDISSDLAETARLDAARQLLEQAQEIERAGYAVCIGLTNRYSINGVRIDMVVIVFIPHREPSGVPLPTEIWLPKKMGMGW